jgi:membrane-associated protease RseP (regulator of RpoE activity)
MVSTLVWVLAGLLAYTLVATALQTSGLLPDAVRVSGPITTIHTQRGKRFLDRLATPKRLWRAWANVGVGIALVVMAGSFVAVLLSAVAIFDRPESTVITQPQDALVIPGVNQFLPLSVAPEIVLGLLIGLVVHEGGHGLLCRVEDIEIESMGLALLAVIPMGAFVEPDEESQANADRGSRTRMFAAGVTNNFAITAITFALLFGPVVGSIAVAPGVPVGGALDGTPAADAGIGRGDVITGVDGERVANESEFDAALADANRTVVVSLQDGTTTTVRRSVVVARALADGPIDAGSTIRAVNGTAVGTERGFHAALENRTTARLTTDDGTVTIPVGAAANVTADGPLASANAELAGESIVVTRLAGERTRNRSALSAALAGTTPNETVSMTAVVDGERGNYSVQLGENPDTDSGFLGVRIAPGTTGIAVDDFGIRSYPASRYLGLLGGNTGETGGAGGAGGSVLAGFLAVITLPFAGAVPGSGGLVSFAGFVGPVRQYFTVTGPLSALGGGVFGLANVLFWTGWINVNLGLFNCIPSFPLDGGHILRASTEAVVSRFPIGGREALTGAVTTAVTLAMLGALAIMVFGPTLLAG